MIRIILAPLQGVTTAPFRSLFAAHFTGCSEAMAPFITTAHGHLLARSCFKDILPENNPSSVTLIPQLLSKDGADFLIAAQMINQEFGYTEINWNIGCPSGTVTGKGRGAGILPHPDVIDRFLNTVCASMPCRLSVKMRLGFKHPREWEALVPILNRYPIHEITVHARTGVQLYGGLADAAMFGELYNALRHPLVYNGDISTVAFARDIVRRYPKISGLMIGRGLIANPLLAAAIREDCEPSPDSVTTAIQMFHAMLFEAYGRSLQGNALLGRMKELVKYWGPRLTREERPLKQVLRARTLEAYRTQMQILFKGA